MRVKCPKCGVDVMVTGWTEIQERRLSWLRFNCGPLQISEELRPADLALCSQCGARLPLQPVELVRIAAA